MSLLQNTVDLLGRLISFPSVSSSSNADISDFVGGQLEALGFSVERTEYIDGDQQQKVNLVARRDPKQGGGDFDGGLAYFCHTDVVPADRWTGPDSDPFVGVVEGDKLFGRGSCDMKGSLATMLAAVSQISAADQSKPIWIVCTADEEVGFEGAKHLVKESNAFRQIVQSQPLAIIGEPTRLSVVHAHKGIVGCSITSRGRAAHSSTTDGINANEAMVPMLRKLLELNRRTNVDSKYHDSRFDPPTLSWNFGVSDQCRAVNITPEKSVAWFSLRPMPEIDGEDLIAEARETAESLGLEFKRFAGGGPMWIDPQAEFLQAMCRLAGEPAKTVCYGTDGGEFHQLQQRLVCGPGDIAQAHTTDEWIELAQIEAGIEFFANLLRRWCV